MFSSLAKALGLGSKQLEIGNKYVLNKDFTYGSSSNFKQGTIFILANIKDGTSKTNAKHPKNEIYTEYTFFKYHKDDMVPNELMEGSHECANDKIGPLIFFKTISRCERPNAPIGTDHSSEISILFNNNCTKSNPPLTGDETEIINKVKEIDELSTKTDKQVKYDELKPLITAYSQTLRGGNRKSRVKKSKKSKKTRRRRR